jgi:hypothetical protein
MDQSNGNPFNFLTDGWMNFELEMELTVYQIRQMMNQEIQNNGGNVKGSIVPKTMFRITWTDLDGYYQMNKSKDTWLMVMYCKPITAIKGKLRNIVVNSLTRSLPYYTRVNNQDWSQDDTWKTSLFGMLLTV